MCSSDLVSFIFVSVFQVYLFWQGVDLVRRFLNFAGPAVYVVMIVALANCILNSNCGEQENGCAGDMNSDGGYNVLDIVGLANCILNSNCGGRVNDATEASLLMENNEMYIKADGFIGGVQMTLSHGDNFSKIGRASCRERV